MKVQFLVLSVALVILVACVEFRSVGAVGTLYGLAPSIARLVKINTTTAQVIPVGRHTYPTELTAQQVSSLDEKRKVYYMIAYNDSDRHVYLIGLSLKDGELVTNIRLPFAESAFIGVGQTVNVMPETGDVLISGRDRILAKHHILRVNPIKRNNTLITSIGGIDVLGGASAYDPINKVLWLQFGLTAGGINLFGFSIPSGQILYNMTDNLNLETMNFDEKSGTIRGIGLEIYSSTNYTRIMMSLDSHTGKTTVLGNINGYFIIDAAVGALNYASRAYYAYLQPSAGNQNTPFNLVTVNADNGKIEAQPIAGSVAALPWSIAYDPTL